MFDVLEFTYNLINPGLITIFRFWKIIWFSLMEFVNGHNFGSVFKKWIKWLYTNPEITVTNNGHATEFFNISRGIGQGCPISTLLFILVAEIMAINIRNDNVVCWQFVFHLLQEPVTMAPVRVRWRHYTTRWRGRSTLQTFAPSSSQTSSMMAQDQVRCT